jgi:hypothetical protein
MLLTKALDEEKTEFWTRVMISPRDSTYTQTTQCDDKGISLLKINHVN